MATSPDLSLPPTAPVERHRDEPMELLPAVLYTLVDLSDAELDELQRVCESQIPDVDLGANVRRPPESRFVGRSLRAVYDYHLELGSQRTFDPIYFVVATAKDWKRKGVLLVTLDDGDFDTPGCKTDSFFIKPAESGLSFVNIQIGNSDWFEERECYGTSPGSDGDGDDDNGNGDGDKSKDDEGHSSDSGPECPVHLKHISYYTALYVVDSVDPDKLIAKHLEPGASYSKKNPATDYFIRCQAILTPKTTPPVNTAASRAPDPNVTEDLISQACTMHPVRCRKNPRLHKTLLLVCDTSDHQEHGILIVRLSWDGVTSGRSKAQLRAIGAAAPWEAQRMPCVVYEGFQQIYCNLHNGVRVWRAAHPRVAAFAYNTGKDASDSRGFGERVLDPERRKDRDEWLVYGPVHPPGPMANKPIEWSFDEAVRRFPWFCRQNRFDEKLLRKYFVCIDNNDPEEKGVLLVRMDWHGNVHRSDEELLSLNSKDRVTSIRVPGKEALGIIEAGLKGDAARLDSAAIEFFRLQPDSSQT